MQLAFDYIRWSRTEGKSYFPISLASSSFFRDRIWRRSINFSKGCSLCYCVAIYRRILLLVCSMNHNPPYLFLSYQLNWVWMIFFSKCWDRVLLWSLRVYILKQLLFSFSVSGRIILTSISKSNCSIVNLYLLKTVKRPTHLSGKWDWENAWEGKLLFIKVLT